MALPNPIQQTKALVRNRQRALSKLLTETQWTEASLAVVERLRQHDVFCRSKRVLFYAAIQGELHLEKLMLEAFASGKIVALPRFDLATECYHAARVQSAAELTQARFGILEPPADALLFPLNQLDLALVPGVAFDCGGGRLGRGKGFYDRLLASVMAVKCGVAFDHQLEPHLPREPHDLTMDCIVTPSRWIDVSGIASRK